MRHSCIRVYLHFVWTTKKRKPLLFEPLQSEVYRFIKGASYKEGVQALAIGGIFDHVHLLVRVGSTIRPADFIRTIKASSSSFIRKTSEELCCFAWQEGYGLFSVSPCRFDTVIRYINNQEEHHKNMTFEEEMEYFSKL